MTATFDSEQRLHYMDNLRALAMLAGVVFHAGLAYSVLLHQFWPTADVGRSVIVDVFLWFSHLFRMPLFFVVAGFFAALLVAKQGVAGMLRNRFKRVLLPFILFWPIVYFAMTRLTEYAANNVENLSPLLMFLKSWFAQANRPTAPPSLMHLWFLPYLFCFCVLVWVANALEIKWLKSCFVKLRPSILLGLAPLVLVLALATVSVPFPAPESFFPQAWAILFYGVYFGFGYQLFSHSSLIENISPFALRLLLAALASYAVFFMLITTQNHLQPKMLWQVLQAILESYIGFWMMLVCLIYGKRLLDRSNRLLRYLADASYWVYIAHLPVLFVIQYALLDVAALWQIKFVISLVATLVIAFASYQLLVRNSVLGHLLNGRRRR